MKLSLSLLLGLLVFSTSPTVSQNKQDQRLESAPDAVTVRGYILDAMCGDVLAKKQKDLMQKASKHTRKCGLAEACAASGYGVFTEGRWVKFDAEGNKLAKAALEKSTKERDLLFSVTGQMKDGLLAVATITEVRREEMEKDAPYRQD
jgi:hypothetical protein